MDWDPYELLNLMRDATPLPWRSAVPERVETEAQTTGPGFVVLSQLDDPEWRATLRGPDGEHRVPIPRLFAYGGTEHGGWQGIRIPARDTGRSGSNIRAGRRIAA